VRLAFGGCVFDSERRELTRDGSPIHAGPKVLGLLELLLEARPKALTKDQIHASLWKGTFVSDATLTSLVAELRAAIGDDARGGKFIRTVQKYGYAFCGDAVAEPAAGPRPARPGGNAGNVRRFRIVAGGEEIALAPGEHILGRSDDAAVFVDDANVSRQHARIIVRGDAATLEDLGSKNGTTLNGALIEGPMPLTDGASIVLGATVLKFRVFDAPASTQTLIKT
jgi:DNA-binding winged helix-turn-helix (wHTH) protein